MLRGQWDPWVHIWSFNSLKWRPLVQPQSRSAIPKRDYGRKQHSMTTEIPLFFPHRLMGVGGRIFTLQFKTRQQLPLENLTQSKDRERPYKPPGQTWKIISSSNTFRALLIHLIKYKQTTKISTHLRKALSTKTNTN